MKAMAQLTGQAKAQTCFADDSKTMTSQVTTILQLTEMVSIVQQENKTIMSQFDQLTEQLVALISTQNPQTQCPARGHGSESSHPK